MLVRMAAKNAHCDHEVRCGSVEHRRGTTPTGSCAWRQWHAKS